MTKKEREHLYWCSYCKGSINEGEAYTVGTNGAKYHPSCYTQENTYTDDFDNPNTDQFGDLIDE